MPPLRETDVPDVVAPLEVPPEAIPDESVPDGLVVPEVTEPEADDPEMEVVPDLDAETPDDADPVVESPEVCTPDPATCPFADV